MNGPIAAIILGELAFVAFVIWVVARFKTERRRQAAEERMRLLERLGGPQEVVDFLNSEAGDKLMRLAQPAPNPTAALTGTLLAGLICLFAGVAFLVITFGFRGDAELAIPGFLGAFVGIGLLIGAVISYFLSRRDARDGR